MRTRLKVCCISSVEEAALAVRCGADALGLVAEMPSGPGVIGDDLIAEIARSTPAGVATFLLTSRTDPDGVVSHVRSAGVSTVQLVDEVSAETYAAIRRHAPGVKIVQVLHVQDEDVLAEARRIEDEVDAILLDSGSPGAPVRELGGTGRTHNWELSARLVAGIVRSAGTIQSNTFGSLSHRAIGPDRVSECRRSIGEPT